MKLYVIAYPELEPADLQMIQDCRKENDRLYNKIGPHFTFVFAVEDFSITDFVAEVKEQLTGQNAFSFVIRCASINKDSFSEYSFAFLVPDEGFSNIKKLHNKLYSGKLSHHHRLDIDYTPHIEIANATDVQYIKKLVDEWNEKDLAIHGKVSALEIISNIDHVFTTVERIELGSL